MTRAREDLKIFQESEMNWKQATSLRKIQDEMRMEISQSSHSIHSSSSSAAAASLKCHPFLLSVQAPIWIPSSSSNTNGNSTKNNPSNNIQPHSTPSLKGKQREITNLNFNLSSSTSPSIHPLSHPLNHNHAQSNATEWIHQRYLESLWLGEVSAKQQHPSLHLSPSCSILIPYLILLFSTVSLSSLFLFRITRKIISLFQSRSIIYLQFTLSTSINSYFLFKVQVLHPFFSRIPLSFNQ